jgi:hypothetical protein
MKTYSVIHQNGLFFNKEDDKRIVFKEQHEYNITGENFCFEDIDTLNKAHEKVRNEDDMYKYVLSKHGDSTFHKLFSRGQKFGFRVGLGKTKDGDIGAEHFFICNILEDLYAYFSEENHFPRLCECKCTVEDSLTANLRLFEPVFANSLNKVAANTIAHFFSLKRSTSMNVPLEFKPLPHHVGYIDELRNNPDRISNMMPLATIIKQEFQLNKKKY